MNLFVEFVTLPTEKAKVEEYYPPKIVYGPDYVTLDNLEPFSYTEPTSQRFYEGWAKWPKIGGGKSDAYIMSSMGILLLYVYARRAFT